MDSEKWGYNFLKLSIELELLILLRRLRCVVMTPCFIHGYEPAPKSGFIAVKHRQTLDWNIPMALFLFHCERTRHPWTHLEHSFLMSKFSVNMRYTELFETPTMSASSRIISRRSSNTILWIFFTISVVITSFGQALWCSSWLFVRHRLKLCHPILHCCKRRCRLPESRI